MVAQKKRHIIPTVLLLAVYMISYIGVGIHECSAEGTREIVSLLGRECAHPHNEHHDENCHHDGSCHHEGNCCHTSILSISEADNGGGSDTLHNYAPDFTTILIHSIFDFQSNELNFRQYVQHSFPLIFESFKHLTVLRL